MPSDDISRVFLLAALLAPGGSYCRAQDPPLKSDVEVLVDFLLGA